MKRPDMPLREVHRLDWLRGHGVEIAESVPIPGCRRFECRDPFGSRLQLIEPLEPG
jgi:hypothetical protein